MNIPPMNELIRDLRIAMLLKADDIYFTVGGDRGMAMRAEFLGADPFEGLAKDIILDEDALNEIDITDLAITEHLQFVVSMLSGRWIGPRGGPNIPDTSVQRSYEQDFLDYFVSSLPQIALGTWDHTNLRNGSLGKLQSLGSAWLELIEAINVSASGEFFSLTVTDVALIAGVDVRTLRNHVGPSRLLRTEPQEANRSSSAPLKYRAFVGVNLIDALGWLRERKTFQIECLSTSWIAESIQSLPGDFERSRFALAASLINFGRLDDIAADTGLATEALRRLAGGEKITALAESALIALAQRPLAARGTMTTAASG